MLVLRRKLRFELCFGSRFRMSLEATGQSRVRVFGFLSSRLGSVSVWVRVNKGNRVKTHQRRPESAACSGLDSVQLGPTRLDSVHLASTQSTRADSVNSVDPVNSVRRLDISA
ncbi:hypothetical protein HanRHA438_Chr11g0510201 [Helianthus annuus]|nr:hypothetical protein HanXRQr2_Chr11g0497561 [Helianthus annuus]KAJ0502045.1 hypothetical protein HanHA300_Chr11g0408171 [Helianthus annuus]KAJ0517969.1 hypothetical protein HanHA89_Chr11g0431871 [Helianthus annuus]KAJ0685988.1 hypothetical protein HanLR1_Chr11g0409401 [Helianthus annuus]KAJ0689846.1 hypothetical protein HanOQP8_Chr11g0410871 [Helianthus annuus]